MIQSKKRKSEGIYKDDNDRRSKKIITKNARVYNKKENRFNSNGHHGTYKNIFELHEQKFNFNEHQCDMRVWRRKTTDKMFDDMLALCSLMFCNEYDFSDSEKLFHENFCGIDTNLGFDTELQNHLENVCIKRRKTETIHISKDTVYNQSINDNDLNLEALYWYLKLNKLKRLIKGAHQLCCMLKDQTPEKKKQFFKYNMESITIVDWADNAEWKDQSHCPMLVDESDQKVIHFKKAHSQKEYDDLHMENYCMEDMFLVNRLLKGNTDCGSYDILKEDKYYASSIDRDVLKYLGRLYKNSLAFGHCKKGFAFIETKDRIEYIMESMNLNYNDVMWHIAILERRFQKLQQSLKETGDDQTLFKMIDYMMSYGDGDLLRYMYCEHQDLMLKWSKHDEENTFYRIIEFLSGYCGEKYDNTRDEVQIKNILFTMVPRNASSWSDDYMKIKCYKTEEHRKEDTVLKKNIEKLFISFSTFRIHSLDERNPKYQSGEMPDQYNMDFELMEQIFGKYIYFYMEYLIGREVSDIFDCDIFRGNKMVRSCSFDMKIESMVELIKRMWGEFDPNDFKNGSVLLKQRLKQFIGRCDTIGMFDLCDLIEMYFRNVKVEGMNDDEIQQKIIENDIFKSAVLFKLNDIENEPKIVIKAQQMLALCDVHMFKFMSTKKEEDIVEKAVRPSEFQDMCQKVQTLNRKILTELINYSKNDLSVRNFSMKIHGICFPFPKKYIQENKDLSLDVFG